MQLDSSHRLHLLQCGHTLHLSEPPDPIVLNSTQESAVPAVVVHGKAGVFVFPVAHGVIVPASGLPVPVR